MRWKRCARLPSVVRKGESSNHSCTAVSAAYSAPDTNWCALYLLISRCGPLWSPLYWRRSVVNSDGISYT